MKVVEYKIQDIDLREVYILGGIYILLLIGSIYFKGNIDYLIVIYSIHSILLISIGIITYSTKKYNLEKNELFIGKVFMLIGLFQIVYTLLPEIYPVMKYDEYQNLIASSTMDIVYIVCIYLYTNSILKESKSDYDNRYFKEIVTFVIVSFIFNTFIINSNFKRVYIIELVSSIFIIYMTYKALKNMSSINLYEKQNLIISIILIGISRIFMFFNLWGEYAYYFSMMSQNTILISVYYIYKYIVKINLKRPYEEIDEYNKILVSKIEDLKKDNDFLLKETDKVTKLKYRLEKEDEKFQYLLDISSNIIMVFDKHINLVYSNERFKDIRQSIDDKIIQSTKISIKESLNTGKKISYFIDGIDDKTYEISVIPIQTNSEDKKVVCILIDKTLERIKENKCIENNLDLEIFLENINKGIVLIDGNNIIYSNKMAKCIFKGSIKEEYFDLDKEYVNSINKYIEEEDIYLNMKYSKFVINGNEKKVVVIKDITYKNNIKNKLIQNHRFYSNFMNTLQDGVCLLDEDLSINYTNKTLNSMLKQIKIENYYNKDINDILKLSDDKYLFENSKIKKVFKDRKKIFIENHDIVNGEFILTVNISIFPFNIEQDSYLMMIFKDISQKRESENAMNDLIHKVNRDKIKTEFFADMSHELKTPLNVINSSNQLMESFVRNNKIKDYNDNVSKHIDLVKLNVCRLQRLINNIIDLTKMDSGMYKLNVSNNNIIQVVEDLFMKVKPYTDRKNIEIVFDTNIEELYINMDKEEVERIVLNVLSNCIKYTDRGGFIYLTMNYSKDSLEMKVTDTGLGIDKESLDIIFEEFIQLDNSLSRKNEGSGIGLSIVKNLIDLHGWDIKIDSDLDVGTTVTVNININEKENKSYVEKRIYDIDEKIMIEFSDIYYYD